MKIKIPIIPIAIGSIIATGAGALDICIKTGSFFGVLKKSLNGTSPTYDNNGKIWRVTYNYTNVNGNANKLITGLASCNTVEGTLNVAKTDLVTGSVDQGENCWCKMWPVSAYGTYTGITSYWVLQSTFVDATSCATGCASACANAMANNTNGFRSAIFDSVK